MLAKVCGLQVARLKRTVKWSLVIIKALEITM